jgi:hypothetical protein
MAEQVETDAIAPRLMISIVQILPRTEEEIGTKNAGYLFKLTTVIVFDYVGGKLDVAHMVGSRESSLENVDMWRKRQKH